MQEIEPPRKPMNVRQAFCDQGGVETGPIRCFTQDASQTSPIFNDQDSLMPVNPM